MNINNIITKYNLKINNFNKNEIIFLEESSCKHVGFIISGKIKISSYLENGDELIYNILNSNDMFGNNLLFSNDNKYLGNVTSLNDSKIILIDKDTFINILQNEKDFLLYYLNYQSENTKESSIRLKLALINNLKERFLAYLSINNNIIIHKSITELANYLFTSREHLSRVISSLKKKN